MNHLRPILVIVAGIALAVAIFTTGPELDPQPPAPKIPIVRTVEALPQAIQMTVAAHGVVVPGSESDLVSEVSGRVEAVASTMVSGGFFREGETLVELERIDYEVALERARARLATAETEFDSAQKAHRRSEELRRNNSVSESLHDLAVQRLDVARASLREAKALVERAEIDLGRTRMRAPYDGRIRSERVGAGQFVSRGESIAQLYSVDFAEVRLPVRDEDLAFLPLSLAHGSPAQMPDVVLRARFAGAEHAWDAVVVRTEGELDPRTRKVNLVAQVPRPYEPQGDAPPLTVGLFVEAEILGKTLEDILVLPRSALQRGRMVYVVEPNRALSFREVEILRNTGDTLYVRGSIAKGELICLSPLRNAIEGQRVQAVAAASHGGDGDPPDVVGGSGIGGGRIEMPEPGVRTPDVERR